MISRLINISTVVGYAPMSQENSISIYYIAFVLSIHIAILMPTDCQLQAHTSYISIPYQLIISNQKHYSYPHSWWHVEFMYGFSQAFPGFPNIFSLSQAIFPQSVRRRLSFARLWQRSVGAPEPLTTAEAMCLVINCRWFMMIYILFYIIWLYYIYIEYLVIKLARYDHDLWFCDIRLTIVLNYRIYIWEFMVDYMVSDTVPNARWGVW